MQIFKASRSERRESVEMAEARPPYRPSLCPRFLSHMKVRPDDLRPPCSLSSRSRPQPPSQGNPCLRSPLLPQRARRWRHQEEEEEEEEEEESVDSFDSLALLINNLSRLFFLRCSSGGTGHQARRYSS
ncbi:hypothetical protein INR49_004980 [Caranx melampygus]|nr:hypothetical protein INR49_004980 [Caranx melampygus]